MSEKPEYLTRTGRFNRVTRRALQRSQGGKKPVQIADKRQPGKVVPLRLQPKKGN